MTIVFVHGVPETDAIWDPLVAALADRGVDPATVVRLSPPGFGSPVPEGFEPVRSSYAAWLADALATVGDERGDDIDLVGHDWGAGHVAGMVTQRPELVRSWAIDVAGIVHPDYVWHDMAQLWRTPEIGEQTIEAMMTPPPEERAVLFEGLGMPAEIAHRVAAGNDETMGRCILALYRSADPDDLRTVWDALETAATRPGLVLVPTEDHYVGPVENSRAVAEKAGARTVELPGLGHWWMCQDPVGAAATLVDFWASV